MQRVLANKDHHTDCPQLYYWLFSLLEFYAKDVIQKNHAMHTTILLLRIKGLVG